EGVKKIISLPFSHWQLATPRPNFGCSEFVEIDPIPLIGMFGMRAHDHADVAHKRILMAPHGSKPAPDNPNLVIGDLAGRAQISNKRYLRLKSELATEGSAIRRCSPIKPTIENLRPGNEDVIFGHTVKFHCLTFLAVVPDGDEIGKNLD